MIDPAFVLADVFRDAARILDPDGTPPPPPFEFAPGSVVTVDDVRYTKLHAQWRADYADGRVGHVPEGLVLRALNGRKVKVKAK